MVFSSFEKINLGGLDQAVLINGESVDLPILLFLHGGPGMSAMPFVSKINKGLEQFFLVVNWDQRGSGKSFSRDFDFSTIRLRQIIDDAKELIKILKTRFNKEKIFLAGHSTGSMIGAYVAHETPQDLIAYIAISQLTNMIENEKISYDMAMKTAEKINDKQSLRRLKALPCYPYFDSNYSKALMTERDVVVKLGGFISTEKNMDLYYAKHYFDKYHPFTDLIFNNPKSILEKNLKALWMEILKTDLSKDITKLTVPAYFFHGAKDMVASQELAQQFFSELKTPSKDFYLMNNSAHFPHLEEPDRFLGLMKNISTK